MTTRKFEYLFSLKTAGVAGFNRINTGMSAFNREIRSTNKNLGLLRGELATIAGASLGLIGIGAATSGLASMVEQVVTAEKELGNFANVAGDSAAGFAAWAYGAETVNVSMEKLADISKDFKDKLGDYLENDGGEAKDFFENVGNAAGVTADKLIQLSGPEGLIAVKKALDDAGVSSERQITYFEQLGNDASYLIPLLEDNGKLWKELSQEAKDLGVAISDLDHQELLELSKILKQFQADIGVTRREIVLALAPAIQDMAEYLSENKEEIREMAVAIAEGAGEAAKFAIENRELLATLLKLGVAMWAIVRVGGALRATFNALNAATLALTGTGIIAHYSKLRTLLLSMQGFQFAGWFGVAGLIAYDIVALKQLWDRYSELKQIKKEIAEQEQSNARSGAELAEKYQEISSSTGVVIKSMEDLDAAVAAGKIRFDEITATWVAGAADMAAAVGDSATEQEEVTGAALSEMKKQYEKYVDEVIRLQEKITERQRTLAGELREMARSGMSDMDAWRDMKEQADEYMQIAQEASQAGDFDRALTYADEAKQLYKELNTEVKENDKVLISQQDALKTAMSGVEQAGELGILVLRQQQEAAKEAMEALNAESGFKNLQAGMDESKRVWLENWQDMNRSTMRELDDVERRIAKIIDDRNMTVYVDVVEKKASGGLPGVVGFSGGGTPAYFRRLSNPYISMGYGVGDDVPALLKRTEFIQPPLAVQHYGVRIMEMMRRRLIPKELFMGFAEGGTPAGPVSLGPVPAAAPAVGGSLHVGAVNISVTGSGFNASPQSIENIANKVMNRLYEKWQGAST